MGEDQRMETLAKTDEEQIREIKESMVGTLIEEVKTAIIKVVVEIDNIGIKDRAIAGGGHRGDGSR